MIRDPEFFALLESLAPALRGRTMPAMSTGRRAVGRNCICAHRTGGDPFELGSSRPLDFGHWAAHKLESLSGHRLRHGEAVAIGIAVDSMYARLSGVLPDADCDRVLTLLTALGFELDAPELADASGNGLLAGLEEFREHLGGRLTIMLLRGIGRPFDVHDIDRDVMIRSVDAIRTFDAAARAGGAARKAS